MAVQEWDKGPERGMRPLSGLERRGTSQLPDCGVINAGTTEMRSAPNLFKRSMNYKSVTFG